MSYPYGVPSTGVFDIFSTSFSPNDIMKAIRDNYSPVNRTSLMNSVGYQLGLVQNFVNYEYLGRETVPVQNAYMVSGWAPLGSFTAYSGSIAESVLHSVTVSPYNITTTDYDPTQIYTSYIRSSGFYLQQSTMYDVSNLSITNSGLEIGYYYTGKPSILSILRPDSVTDQAIWKVNGANNLIIANSSHIDYPSSFSGLMEFVARKVTFNTYEGIVLSAGSSPSFSTISFCGSNLRLVGPSINANIITYHDILPSGSDALALGNSNNFFNYAYINRLMGGSTVTNVSTCGYVHTSLGTVAGQEYSDIFSFYSHYNNNSSITVLEVGLKPNQVYLRRSSPNISGYLQLNSAGQLEFYKIGSSGWVLTNF